MSQEYVANFYKFRIPKRSGGFRTILAPDEATKGHLRSIAYLLGKLTAQVCDLEVVHGFVPGRSPVTNAWQHVGRQYSVCLDIEDFFDHITPELVGPAMRLVPKDLVMPEGFAAQGLPTSPALSNLAMIQFDALAKAVLSQELAWHYAQNVVYTRYADDITVSFDVSRPYSLKEIRETHVSAIVKALTDMLEQQGMCLNGKKTRLLHASGGRRRRIITGISVGQEDVRVPRSFRRRLRAAQHKRPQSKRTRGMQQWAMLKPPKDWNKQIRSRAERLSKLQRELIQIKKDITPLTVRVFAD